MSFSFVVRPLPTHTPRAIWLSGLLSCTTNLQATPTAFKYHISNVRHTPPNTWNTLSDYLTLVHVQEKKVICFFTRPRQKQSSLKHTVWYPEILVPKLWCKTRPNRVSIKPSQCVLGKENWSKNTTKQDSSKSFLLLFQIRNSFDRQNETPW